MLLVNTNSNAFQLNVTTMKNEVTVNLTGSFDEKSYDMLTELLTTFKSSHVTIFANSNGGDASRIVDIMDAVYAHGKVNWVVNDFCASACAWTAIASRTITGPLRFHGVYDKKTKDLIYSDNFKISTRLWQYNIQPGNWFGSDLVTVNFQKSQRNG